MSLLGQALCARAAQPSALQGKPGTSSTSAGRALGRATPSSGGAGVTARVLLTQSPHELPVPLRSCEASPGELPLVGKVVLRSRVANPFFCLLFSPEECRQRKQLTDPMEDAGNVSWGSCMGHKFSSRWLSVVLYIVTLENCRLRCRHCHCS